MCLLHTHQPPAKHTHQQHTKHKTNNQSKGRVLQEYTADIDAKLRASELESIEDYIAESGSLVALHDQV